ncbi:MAG: penicillin-binding protein 1B, partial [Gammaproteobacteria bacterium]|nr:penicillin-binding protein 1B [Gammaproteobacteria bacterium]
ASSSVIAVNKRAFDFWDGLDDSRRLRISFNGNEISKITAADKSPADLVRFDPLYIGGIYPEHAEDRILVKLEEVPELLTKGLISVEDKAFYQHYGVSPKSIVRALVSNIKAGKSVQGGSTLTQQLVKNFYLSSERSLKRKLNEAMMSVLLELHYDKPEILQAYLNEIYLGQAGKRAIHGFGLASHFYFERPLDELDLPKIALLIGMVKGPSVYNPRRNPKNATARRNLVLNIMRDDGVITAEQASKASKASLGITRKAPTGTSRFPAFMQLLKSQLKQDYKQQDLETEGLKVFSTLNPLVQQAAEQSLSNRLTAIEKDIKLKRHTLQGAAIVTSSHNGELLALVGGREARYSGFNRALNARRQVGSILKPAIYATAYGQSQRYSMLTPLDDSPLQVRTSDSKFWEPNNYDGEFHGLVPLYSALAHSYNVSSARLGLTLGLENVFDTLYRLGISRKLPPYPSVLLGAAELTPLEVAGMYQTLAANGFQTPVRAIRDVLDADNTALQRYPIRLDQVLDPAVAYLTNASLIEVMRNGTGRSFYWQFPKSMVVAGKTGTTNELRDSWFAGFSNDKLGVVWVGNDDNKPVKLTGSNGALRVWTDMMKQAGIQSLRLTPPDNIEFSWIEQSTGLLSAQGCEDAVQFPFIRGSAPTEESSCITDNRPIKDTIRHKVKSFWESIFGE